MIQLNERKDKNTNDHSGTAGVVWIGGRYESIVLSMLQRSDTHLSRAEQVGVTNAFVLNIQLEYAVDVWDNELGAERSRLAGG